VLIHRIEGGGVLLDPHAVGCVVELDQAEAVALRDLLVEWFRAD
jgi:5,10-methenyltetrahydromethanopterin hydrogenase